MTVRLAVLGDSIAWGQGAARPQDRPGPRLAEALQRHGYDVEHRVFAVPGARSAGLPSQVRDAVRWEPTLALVVIGANDLTHLEAGPSAVATLGAAVRGLRSAGAEVVVAPAPDLSAVPHVPPALRGLVQSAGDVFRRQQVAVVLEAGGHLADPEQRASRAFAVDPGLFSPDRFHPSSAGYAVITDALLPAVLGAAGSSSSR